MDKENMYRIRMYSLPTREPKTGKLLATYDISGSAVGEILRYIAECIDKEKAEPTKRRKK